MKLKYALIVVALILYSAGALAHVDGRPSVHDVLAGVVDRLKAEKSADELSSLTLDEVEAFLTEDERHHLGTGYLRFEIDRPAIVSIVHDIRLRDDPFWVESEGFERTDYRVMVSDDEYDVWEKRFDAGEVGLGVNSLTGRGNHYFVIVRPANGEGEVRVTEVYPGQHGIEESLRLRRAYSDDGAIIMKIPEKLSGHTMVQGLEDRERDAQLVNVFLQTPYPASDRPDHIALTWSEDPKTTQTIQWRTSADVSNGVVEYMEKRKYDASRRATPRRVQAITKLMETPYIVNDPKIHRHTATLRDLKPDTIYVYAVGDGSEDGWSALAEFTTAPEIVEPFSFIYMGDAQNGLERWGSLIQESFVRRPEAKFYVMAGDLVNRGNDRDDWDSYFENARGVLDNRQIVPVPGNHEYQGGDCQMYLDMFTLPDSSPVGEKAYTLEYSNALFVMLDSNIDPRSQEEWLDEQLANSDATWKFVVYHHPAYSSSPNRNNPGIRKIWGALFDKYHVDLALQGHDHAYLRTYPMNDEEPVDSPSEGTIYIVSVSGTKYYEQGDFDYKEFGMTNVSTYQLLDIHISGDRLVYRSFDQEGTVRDEFVIEK